MTNTVSRTVSDETLNCFVQIESGGDPNAKASTSSALGLGQFLNKTWEGVIEKHRPDLADIPVQRLLAMRLNPSLSIEMLARFAEDNLAVVGRGATGGDLYLAHFLGAGTARRLFRADPATPVAEIASPEAIRANRSIMEGKTCGQVRAWAARRMAQSSGHNWVAKFYKPPQAAPQPDLEPVDDEPEDVADPQRPDPVPLPAPRPANSAPAAPAAPSPVTPKENEDFFSWIKRKGKTIAGWISGGTLGTGILSSFTDWRVVAVIVGGVVLSGALAGLFYIASRRSST